MKLERSPSLCCLHLLLVTSDGSLSHHLHVGGYAASELQARPVCSRLGNGVGTANTLSFPGHYLTLPMSHVPR